MSPHTPEGERDEVVLLSDDGEPIGVADRRAVHGPTTPYHLAFSCYGFNAAGDLLITRRALTKSTWPGVWTNTCCGHPRPGEAVPDSVGRRMPQELGIGPEALTLALPDFSYRAHDGAFEEHELCPVFLCRITAEPSPAPEEVDDVRWVPWAEFVGLALAPDSTISPWARLQVRQLLEGGHVERFLGLPPE